MNQTNTSPLPQAWEYGINIDWAGILVERVSGLKLNDYFQQHIFKPMGITHISRFPNLSFPPPFCPSKNNKSFQLLYHVRVTNKLTALPPFSHRYIDMFPTSEMKSQLAWMNARSPKDGSLALNMNGHLNRRPLTAKTQAELDDTFHAGGAGCFARPNQYAQIIATLLNDGVHPGSGNRILKKETVDQMFTNQVRYYSLQGGRFEASPKKSCGETCQYSLTDVECAPRIV